MNPVGPMVDCMHEPLPGVNLLAPTYERICTELLIDENNHFSVYILDAHAENLRPYRSELAG